MTFLSDYGALIDLEEKALAEVDECYVFTGYASVFNNVDHGNDVMVPGAFSKSLRDHGLPLLLYQHDMKEIVGAIVDAKEDKKGLWVKGELPKDDDFVRGRLVPQLKRRGLKGMSIGYKVQDSARRKEDGARLLKQVRLYETSFVSLAMNDKATVETIKGLVPFLDCPIDLDATAWDAKATFEALKAKHGDSVEDLRASFLYADPDTSADAWDLRLLIAGVDGKANHLALKKAAAVVFGAGDVLPQGAEAAVKGNLDAYFQRLNLESPSKTYSVAEYEAQSEIEREARLRGFGVSRSLVKRLLSGQRDADRDPTLREAGSPTEDAQKLLAALADFASSVRKR